jgi:hypothetical protein
MKNTLHTISSTLSSKRVNAMKTPIMSLGATAILSALLMSTGCGLTPSVDIDRVQPNYTKKTIFQGEWYMRPIVVQKQYTASFPFEGYEGGMELVRWEVTESRLNAFRAYEKAPGTETDDPGAQTLVASFPITAHFDIRRQYNPVNGVETNVIEENTVDRPWWEREYIRVDWSNQTAPWISDVQGWIAEITAVTVNRNTDADPTDPWRVRVTPDYIETTIDAIVEPDWQTCYYLGSESFACTGVNAKLKYGFMKKTERNYEPLNYPDRVAQ